MKNTNYIFDPICITSIFRDTTKQYFILMGSTLLTTAVTYGDRLILYPLMDGNSVFYIYSSTTYRKDDADVINSY